VFTATSSSAGGLMQVRITTGAAGQQKKGEAK
jgi:hypothetical protein